MSNDTAAIRSLMIYAICLPLAIVLGYLISDPLDQTTDLVLGLVLLLLLLPLLFRWYHAWLIGIWNMSITFVFLPGLFPGWIPMACLAFGIAVGHYILNRERKFLEAPAVTRSLIFLALVVLVTAKFRGGIGFRALGGDSIGGKRYLWIWVAVLAYFALISEKIPLKKRKLYATLFLLGGATQFINEASASLGPAFRFLFIFFPGSAASGNSGDLAVGPETVARFGGLSAASVAVAFTLVARYGIEGVLDLRKFWRPLLFFSALLLSAFGGFRSIMISIGLTLVLVFYFEGLFRSRLMPVVLLGSILVGGLTLSFSEHLPLSFQRCLAFLPVKIDPLAKMSAEATSEWRMQIWTSVIPQIPKYLLLGKGLAIDPNELASYATLGNNQVGGEVGGGFTLAGDYHNGPLSVIIPFGIWGCIAFIWFLAASVKVLWANYKYGDPEIRKINTFLLSYFITRIIVFFLVFGGFYSEVVAFVGLIGFSISLNGGVAKPVVVTRPQVVFNRFRSLPMGRPAPSS